MNSTYPKITITDVDQVLPLKSWWAMVAVLPLVRPLTVLVVNYTRLSPNSITVASLFLRIMAALGFLSATRGGLILGAIAFYFAYLLDCMDGAVARLRRMSSEFGRFLDHVGDLAGGLFAVSALAYGQGMLVTPLILGLLFCHVAEYYISFLTSSVLSGSSIATRSASAFWSRGLVGCYVRYRLFFHSRNIKSFFSFPDYEALTFLVFPLLGKPVTGLEAGFYVALLVTLHTVLSSFVAIHSGSSRFP